MSQDCGRPFAEALITGYLDGAISPNDGRRVHRHLQRCAACRRLLDDMRDIRIVMLSGGLPPEHYRLEAVGADHKTKRTFARP